MIVATNRKHKKRINREWSDKPQDKGGLTWVMIDENNGSVKKISSSDSKLPDEVRKELLSELEKHSTQEPRLVSFVPGGRPFQYSDFLDFKKRITNNLPTTERLAGVPIGFSPAFSDGIRTVSYTHLTLPTKA